MSEAEEQEDSTEWLDRVATQAQDTIEEIYTEAREAIYAEDAGEQPAGSAAEQAEVRWPQPGQDSSTGY
jgi:hypothetical protein